MESTEAGRSWYGRWWGILLIILAVIFLGLVSVFAIITYRYVQEIKSGGGSALKARVYNGFTAATTQNTAAFGIVTRPNRDELVRGDTPVLGNPKAAITIVEFLDFKCPNCAAAAPVMRQVLEKYGSKVTYAVRHFPVESTHPGASRFAELGWCAGQQGRFWPALNYFFEHQAELPTVLSAADLAVFAKTVQLDEAGLGTCLTSSAAQTAVNRDYVDGAKFGVRGTPTFFVNGEKIEGAVPFAVWESFLKEQ